MRCGVRCADTTLTSYGTSNSVSASAAAFMTGQSESLPMITPTSGLTASAPMNVVSVQPYRVRQPVRGQLRPLTHVGHRRAEHRHVADLAARPFLLAVVVHMGVTEPRQQVVQSL